MVRLILIFLTLKKSSVSDFLHNLAISGYFLFLSQKIGWLFPPHRFQINVLSSLVFFSEFLRCFSSFRTAWLPLHWNQIPDYHSSVSFFRRVGQFQIWWLVGGTPPSVIKNISSRFFGDWPPSSHKNDCFCILVRVPNLAIPKLKTYGFWRSGCTGLLCCMIACLT